MAIRLMKNVPATSFPLMALAMYAYLRTVLGLAVIDTVGTWTTTLSGSDGSTVLGTPNRFYVSTLGVFLPAHVGHLLAVRDNAEPRNSGVYVITSVAGDGSYCTLMAPVGTFVSTSSALIWSLHDVALPPASAEYFVVSRPGSTPTSWQLQVTVHADSVRFIIAPRGDYSTVSHTFTGVTLTPISLGPSGVDTPTLQFAVGDDVAGWVTFWIRTAASAYAIVHLGEYSPFHATGLPGTPQDDMYVGAFGQALPAVDSCEVDPTNATALGSSCYVTDHDKVTSVRGRFVVFAVQGSTTDLLASAAYALNPRSGQRDDFPCIFGIPAATSIKQIRGVLKGVRRVNSTTVALTMVAAGSLLALGGGVAVPWDATTPI